MVSKACVVGQYQTKLEALARQPGLDLTVVVPPYWKDERGTLPLEKLHTRGYTLRVEPMRLNGHFHLHYYPTLTKVVAETRPDIIHVDEEPYNFATFHALGAARRSSARQVFFTWQNILRRYPFPFSWFESRVLQNATAIAGNAQAAEVLRLKGYSRPVEVIPQFGINADDFAPPAAPKAAGTILEIGYVGRFVQEKGLEMFLQALAHVRGAWHLHLVGSGPLKPRLLALAGELGIGDRVQIVDWMASAEMPAYYRRLDLVVLPSLTKPNWKEQFGRALVEAMATEIPVIGSSSGEIPNVIGDGGLVFPEGDAETLADQIEALLHDPEQRSELGRRGRERVLRCYTQERIAERTASVYRGLTGEPGVLLPHPGNMV